MKAEELNGVLWRFVAGGVAAQHAADKIIRVHQKARRRASRPSKNLRRAGQTVPRGATTTKVSRP
jgi:hypothetical protein